jgi:hypothetical protein
MIRALGLGLLALFILLPLAQAVLLSLTLTLPRDGMAEGHHGPDELCRRAGRARNCARRCSIRRSMSR